VAGTSTAASGSIVPPIFQLTQRAGVTFAGKGRERQQHDQERHQHLQPDGRAELAETARGGRILDGTIAGELLLMRLEKYGDADKGVEAGIDSRERLDGLEDKRAEVSGGVRVHLALVERDGPFRTLRLGAEALRGSCARPAGEQRRREDREEKARGPAKAAVAPQIERVPGRDGQAVAHRGGVQPDVSCSWWWRRPGSTALPWP
jgi:hypothetical protein